jgi:hypothetical protein
MMDNMVFVPSFFRACGLGLALIHVIHDIPEVPARKPPPPPPRSAEFVVRGPWSCLLRNPATAARAEEPGSRGSRQPAARAAGDMGGHHAAAGPFISFKRFQLESAY